MTTPANWLGLGYYVLSLANASPLPPRAQLNFIAGSGTTITLADNDATQSTDVTITATGGGGSLSPGTARQALFTNSGATAYVWETLAGDVTCPTTPGTLEVTGLLTKALPSLPGSGTSVLQWSSGAFSWAALSGSLTPGAAGQFLVTNAAASAYEWATLSGDVADSATTPGQLTVVGLQGRTLESTAPSDGYVITWSASNAWWYPAASASGGITALTGDVVASGSGSVAADVVNLSGSSGVCTVSCDTLQWNSGVAPEILYTGSSTFQVSATSAALSISASTISLAAGTSLSLTGTSFFLDASSGTGTIEASGLIEIESSSEVEITAPTFFGNVSTIEWAPAATNAVLATTHWVNMTFDGTVYAVLLHHGS